MADHPVHKIIELTADEGITLQKSSDGKNLKVSANITQVQSDWNQTTSSAADFIKNKPTIPAAQVNADWNASSGVAQILNKPTIPAAQVNSDWNASSGVAQILNKPSIPDPQIQSDWEQSDNSAVDFIKNKPTIPQAVDFLCINNVNYESYICVFKPLYKYCKTDGFTVSLSTDTELAIPLETGFIYNVTGILKIKNDDAFASINHLQLELEEYELDEYDDPVPVGTPIVTSFYIDYVNTYEKLVPFSMILPGTTDRFFKIKLYICDTDPTTGEPRKNGWRDGVAGILGLVIQKYAGTEYSIN